jgi:hypothetical protein
MKERPSKARITITHGNKQHINLHEILDVIKSVAIQVAQNFFQLQQAAQFQEAQELEHLCIL